MPVPDRPVLPVAPADTVVPGASVGETIVAEVHPAPSDFADVVGAPVAVVQGPVVGSGLVSPTTCVGGPVSDVDATGGALAVHDVLHTSEGPGRPSLPPRFGDAGFPTSPPEEGAAGAF